MMNKEDRVANSIRKGYKDVKLFGDFLDVRSVCHHSAKAKHGALFVCLCGASNDGHDFALEAYKAGCRHFLCERELSLPPDASVAMVNRVRAHLYAFLSDFYGYEDRDFRICAVTGTKGKTTTAYMLYHILKRKGYKVACSSTLGLLCEEEKTETENTTPDAFILSEWLGKMKQSGIRYIILEVSSAALSGGRVYGMHFDIGILTSFSRDHIGKGEHSSMAEYLCAKKSLFSLYGIQAAILPSGIYRGDYIVSDAKRIVSLPSDSEVILQAEERMDGQSFLYKNKTVKLSVSGAHNRTNARLALCAAAVLTGEREEAFFPSLSDCRIAGRLEQFLHKGVLVVIDYAHNSESFAAVARSVQTQTDGRRICVFGSVGERGEDRRTELARAACSLMDFSVITEDDSGRESPFHICSEIYAAFPEKCRARIVSNREDAIRYAFSLCRAGDALLLLGKGHEKTIKRGGRAVPFSEREIVLSL